MSEQESAGNAWGDPISGERKAELKALVDRQREWVAQPEATRGDSVFQGVKLTGADVSWLVEEAGRDDGRVPGLHLEKANFMAAHLEGADFWRAQLKRVNLHMVHLEGADLSGAYLEGADLHMVHLEGADLSEANLEGANLIGANLEGATAADTILKDAYLHHAQLKQAILMRANLEGADLKGANLEGADLSIARMDKTTRLNNATLNGASLDQLSFDGANLAVVNWGTVTMLGDEVQARTTMDDSGERKDREWLIDDYEAAVRAYLQLATALRSQGMNEQADRFMNRSQEAQRTRYRLQRRYGQWLFSWLLFLLAGYGYRLERILISYGLIVGVFAAGFLISDVVSGQGAWTVPHALDALQISLNAIHGRVFFAQFNLDTIQSWLATTESIVGIVIEGIFVAMLIQRFFAR